MKILIIFLIASHGFASNISTLLINEKNDFSIKDQAGGKNYYSIHLSEKQQGKDLVVQLLSQSAEGDPDLKLFLNLKTEPTITDLYFCFSNNFKQDICIISEENLKEEQYILIEVSCASSCAYSLINAYKEKKLISLESNLEIQLHSNKGNLLEQFFILLPHSDNKNYEVIISATFLQQGKSTKIDKGLIDMFGNFEQNAKNKQYAQLKTKWTSDDSLQIKLEAKDIVNISQLSIILSAQFKVTVLFQVEFYHQERPIQLEKQIYDNLNSGQVKNFIVKLDQERQDISEDQKILMSGFLFSLTKLQGNPELYVHCSEKKPESLTEYDWKLQQSQQIVDNLFIESDCLSQTNDSSAYQVYIAVHSDLPSTFLLKVIDNLIDSDRENGGQREIDLTEEITGYIEKERLQYLYFSIIKNKRSQINMILRRLQGSPDIFIKELRQSEDDDYDERYIEDDNESISFAQEIQEYYENKKKYAHNFIGISSNSLEVDTIRLKMSPISCYDIYAYDNQEEDYEYEEEYIFEEQFCEYQIGIYERDQLGKYQIEFKWSHPYYIQEILTNENEEYYLKSGKEQYFVYTLDEEQFYINDIQKILIYFQITNDGFATIEADRSLSDLLNHNPEKNYKQGSSSCVIEYNASQNLEINSANLNFYIRISALQSTSYQIQIQVLRNEQQIMDYSEIFKQTPLKFLLQENSKISLKFHQEQSRNTIILVKSEDQIEVKLQGKNILNFDEGSSNNIKRMKIDPKTVTCIDLDEKKQIKNYCSFSIKNTADHIQEVEVQLQDSLLEVYVNQIIEEMIYKGESKTYFWNLKNEELSKETTIIISSPNSSFFQITTAKFLIDRNIVKEYELVNDYEFIQFIPSVYNEFCQYEYDQCFIYIIIQTSHSQIISISLNQNSFPITLSDYKNTISQIPFKSENRLFNFLLLKQNEIILNVQSDQYPLIILGKIYKLNEQNPKNVSLYPNSVLDSKLSFSTQAKNEHHIRITPYTFNGDACLTECFVAITVILGDDQVRDNLLIGSTFTLGINGSSIKIFKEREAQQVQVQKGQLTYCRFHVSSENERDELFITFNSLNKESYQIFLNKGTKLPTQKDNDITQNIIGKSFIQIDKNSLEGKGGIKGEYLVGIFGTSDSVISICYFVGKNSIQKIEEGNVQEINLNTGDSHFMIFDKTKKGFFTVKTLVISGNEKDMLIFLQEYNNYEDILQHIIEEKNSKQIKNSNQNTPQIQQKETLIHEQSKCESCIYLIRVKALKSISYSILVNIENNIFQLENNTILEHELIQSEVLKFIFSSSDDFNLILAPISGQCINVKVYYSSIQSQGSLITQKSCSDQDGIINSIGNRSQNIHIKYPINPENKNQESEEKIDFNFQIELLSLKDENVFVYGIRGRSLKLINLQEKNNSEVSKQNSTQEFFYFSSNEENQQIQLFLTLIEGEQINKEILLIQMKEANSDNLLTSSIVYQTSSSMIISFNTKQNQPYFLSIKYSGESHLKFSFILKYQSLASINNLDTQVRSTLQAGESEYYVIHTKPYHKLIIQNFNCQNEQSISFYSNIEDLFTQKENSSLAQELMESNLKILIFKGGEQNLKEIYLQIANKGTEVSESLLTVHDLNPKQLLIYEKLEIGEEGKISSSQDSDNIYAYFYPLKCKEQNCSISEIQKIQKIEYQIHIGEDIQQLTRITNCDSDDTNKKLIVKGDDTNNKLIVEGDDLMSTEKIKISQKKSEKKKFNDVFFSITAKVFILNSVEDQQDSHQLYSYIYESKKIDDKQESVLSNVLEELLDFFKNISLTLLLDYIKNISPLGVLPFIYRIWRKYFSQSSNQNRLFHNIEGPGGSEVQLVHILPQQRQINQVERQNEITEVSQELTS